jgi:hypothetical protein
MKKICDKCGGSGTLPEEPKTPPVITVRIKRCSSCNWYEDSLGRIFDVTDNAKFGNYRYTYLSFIAKEDCEVIPPYDKTKFRLRRKYKDEELVQEGDLCYWDYRWNKAKHLLGQPFPRHQGQKFIYITPITPDLSADKPPIGIIPKTVHASIRRMSIKSTIRRYTKADKEIPLAWIHEYNELVVEMKKESE